jgi:sugar porter (SP) family MFS transporter
MLMSGYQVAVQTGALIGFWGAFVSQATLADTSALQWQLPVGAQFFAGLILLTGTLVVPESPRYLAERGHHHAVAEALSWLRRLPQSDPRLLAEREEIDAAAALSEKLKRYSFTGELRKKDVRRRLGVGVGLMVAQNMVGLNALNYYAPVIFMSAGFTSVSSSLFLTGLFGVVKLVSATAFMFVFVRVRGNRFWLRLGSAVCAVAMLVLAYNVRLLPSGHDAARDTLPTRGSGIVSVAMVYLFAFAFGVSLGPISWNVCSEIFPLHINATCCAITTCTQWVFQIVIAAITPPLLAGVGWATYLIYAAFCILSFVWVHLCVPETRGVGVGRPMDDVFGAGRADGDHGGGGDGRQQDEEEEVEEAFLDVSETTALLLAYDRRRRSSLAAYT